MTPANLARPILACGLLALLASGAAHAKKAPKADAAQQFIDRTLVDYPRRLGDDVLAEAVYDPADFALGVTLNYTVQALPEARFSLYVYPRGRMPAAQSIAASLGEIRTAVDYYGQQGHYTQVAWGDSVAVDLALPPDPAEGAPRGAAVLSVRSPSAADAQAATTTTTPAVATTATTPAPAAAGKPPSPDEDPAFLAAIAASADDRVLHGQRLSVAYSEGGVAQRSLGYAFYYRLNAIKVRVTGPAARLDQAAFEHAADVAVGRFVGALDVTNVGTCGSVTISTGQLGKDDNAAMIALLEGTSRVLREGCSGRDTPLLTGNDRQVVAYPAGTWKSE